VKVSPHDTEHISPEGDMLVVFRIAESIGSFIRSPEQKMRKENKNKLENTCEDLPIAQNSKQCVVN